MGVVIKVRAACPENNGVRLKLPRCNGHRRQIRNLMMGRCTRRSMLLRMFSMAIPANPPFAFHL